MDRFIKGEGEVRERSFSLSQILTLTAHLVTPLLSLSLTMAGNQSIETWVGMLMAVWCGTRAGARRQNADCPQQQLT